MVGKQDSLNSGPKSGDGFISPRIAARGRQLMELYNRIGVGTPSVTTAIFFLLSVVLGWLTGNSRIVSFVVSLTLFTFCLLLFKSGPVFRTGLFRSIRAMWVPIAVTVLAGFLLFHEDQGKDLGVGLLGEGQFKLILLFLILIYWAVNNWHSARLGLNYEFYAELNALAQLAQSGEDPVAHMQGGIWRWLFWPPRFLGVCAHLFAALSLALAGFNIVTASGTSSSAVTFSNLLVFTAPLIIALVTLAVWAFDAAYISENRQKPIKPKSAWWIVGASCTIAIGLLVCLWWIEDWKLVPEGLFSATFWVSLSAVVFLYFVSRAKKHYVPALSRHDWFTVGLAIPPIVVSFIVCFIPTFVGEWLGSLNVFFFAFGAVLAIINAIGAIGSQFVDMNDRAQRLRFGRLCIGFLLLLAAFTSVMRDFHRVRLCEGDSCKAVSAKAEAGSAEANEKKPAWAPIASVEDRPTVREAALAWYEQASKLYPKDDKGRQKPVPMLVIATAGGGIRAAYWTATILEQLQTDLKKKGKDLDKLLFAISGVSGGSVGAMEYVAALQAGDVPTNYLQSDFLAPAIASLVFVDGISNFLPDFGQVDRGTALEQSFENGSKGNLGYSFLSFFPGKSDMNKYWRPALLLNATHQETGRRVIASNLKIEKDTFLDSFDELELLDSDLRASTVAHNSARFTYVSPAGKLVPRVGPGQTVKVNNRGYVIDGGYFENYGALTALELARAARQEIESIGGSVKLVILQISSDPTLTKERTRVRTLEDDGNCTLSTVTAPSKGKGNYLSFEDGSLDPVTHRWHKNDGEGLVVAYLNELAAPLAGLKTVREAHGTLAAAELASAVCVERNVKAADTGAGKKQQPAGISDTLGAKPAAAAAGVPSSVSSTATTPIPAAPHEKPNFAHLAMCEVSEIERAPIVPPLGWVLSKPLRKQFHAIFEDCGNPGQLSRLEQALD